MNDLLEVENAERDRYRRLFKFNGGCEGRTFDQFAAGLDVEDVERGSVAGDGNSEETGVGTSGSAFWEAVKERMSATKCTKAEAVRFVVCEKPDLHRDYLLSLGRRPASHQESTGGDFMKAVETRVSDTRCSKAAAIRFVISEQPGLHEKFLLEQEDAAVSRRDAH